MRTVFYSPAPYPADEHIRRKIASRLLAEPLTSPELQLIVDDVARSFATPMAAITILDEENQWLPVRTGLDAASTPRAAAFCGYTVACIEPIVVPDAHADERFAGNPFVVHEGGVRFYAGSRVTVQGVAVGALCAVGTIANWNVSKQQIERLERQAEAVSRLLEERFLKSDDTSIAASDSGSIVAMAATGTADV
jgi:GAF domain-containing protein